MDTEHTCPSCKKPLPPNAPIGLCPECLMKAGLQTGIAAEAGGPSKVPRFVAPSVEELAKLFPQFEILELLGQGGMGAVYKARQRSLDRLVAIKILPPQTRADTGFTDRFTREARALARLSHPNIVAVHEFGQVTAPADLFAVPSPATPSAQPVAGTQPSTLNPQPSVTLHYFVMEYVDGLNLRQLEQAGKLAPQEALKIIPQICDALQFAHEEGIVHRDIKPENVMLDTKGRVKITDFGLAKILGLEPQGPRLTGAKDVMGTPHYMAPEQLERPQDVDHRADIYSLGVVFYEMLTGELPLGKFQPPSRKVHVDVRLDEVVLHALEKEPQRRYQQASEVKSDVAKIATTPEQAAAPVPFAPVVPPRPTARGSAKVIIPAVGLVVAGLMKLFSALTVIILLGNPRFNWLGHILGPATSFLPFSNPLFFLSLGLFKAIPAVLMIYGGLQMAQMRSYAWSIAAAILGIVSCSFIGFPMGIWGLIVLAGMDVREAFANPPPREPGRPATWGWVWPVTGALTLLLVLGMLGAAVVGAARTVAEWRHGSSGSGTNFFEPMQDTAETNLAVSSAALAEAPASNAQQMASSPAETGPINRTVSAGSEANVSKSFTVPGDGKLVMNVERGGIRVVGADQHTVDVRVTREVRHAGNWDVGRILADEKLTMKQAGDEITISAQEPSSLQGTGLWGWAHPDLDVNYDLTVPRKCDVRLKTAGGGIHVVTVQGPVNVRTEGGGLEFDRVDGDVDGETQGGGIHATGCKGKMAVKTQGGGIHVASFGGPSVQAETQGGSVSAELETPPKSDCLLHTEGGSVSIKLPGDAGVTLDAHTEGGSVKSDLPVESEEKAENNTLRGKINGGGPLVKLETAGGSIRVLKQ